MENRVKGKVLFLIPGASFDTPSGQGLLGHKFDYIYEAFTRAGWDALVLFDVYTKRPKAHKKYKARSLGTRFMISMLLTLIHHPLRIALKAGRLSFINQSSLELLYLRTVQTSRASVVLAIGASEALVKACRTQGVRCIEIQHGMFGPDDFKLYWPNGYPPDSFLSWDSYSSRVAEQAGMGATTIGHPDAQNKASTSEMTGSHICVSLGKNASDSEDRWGCFPRRLTKIIDALIADDVPVLVRLHPTIASQSLTAKRLTTWIHRRFGEVRVDNPLEVPLSLSIGRSFANLTGSSATWFEFALAGKTTFVYDSTWADRFREHASAIQFWDSKQSPIQLFSSESSIGACKATGSLANVSFLSKNLVPIDDFVRGLSSR